VEGVAYADSGGHHLAHRVLGGPDGRDIVLFTPGGTVPMDALAADPIGARLLEGLAGIGRLVLFDRRGIGLSDPITDWSRALVEQWADDLATVIEQVCLAPPVVVSLGDYWGPARLFAGSQPDRLSALVLYEPTGPSQSVDLTPSVTVGPAAAGQAEVDWIATVCPSRAHDPSFRTWFDAAGRRGASPAVAARLYEAPPPPVVRRLEEAQARITVPTVVLRRPGNLLRSAPEPDAVATAIPRGSRVDLPGADYHWLGEDVDSLLSEISWVVLGERRVPAPDRALQALLFTDLVRSTQQATELGDRRWRAVLDRHDGAIARAVARHGGRVVKSTGDGVLAALPSADGALRAATAIRDGLLGEDLVVRIGLHLGDVERRGEDVAGVTVHAAARVMALAAPGEILVTTPVEAAAVGGRHRFEPAGTHDLKGLPGRWELRRYVGAAGPAPP
jgi:class 3 adenylate cyclase